MIEPPILDDPIEYVNKLIAGSQKRIMIALAGLPGSGKSTFAHWISEQTAKKIGADALISLGMDGFHFSKAHLAEMLDPVEALRRRGAPWTFDSAALASRVTELRESAGTRDVLWPGFEHGAGDPADGAFVVAPDVRVVLVEGLYMIYDRDGWENVSSQFDEHWFLDTAPATANERLISRHMRTRGISRKAAEIRFEENDKLNADLTYGTRQLAGWRVHSPQ